MQEYNVLSTASVEDDCSDGETDDPDLPYRSAQVGESQGVRNSFAKDTSNASTEPLLKALIRSKLPETSKRRKWSPLRKHVCAFFHTFRQIFTQSWLNVLLVFVPFGIASNSAGLQPIVVFALNALAIIPLTGLLTFATENAAQSLGVGAGALLNITFGNMVEFIILFMLREGHLRLVLSSLLGSIFVNLLFILGLAIMAGGIKHKDQKYNKKLTQMLIYFMNMGVLSLLIPTSLHASINRLKQADSVTLKFSHGISVALFVLYALYLQFLLRYHPDVAEGKFDATLDEEASPGVGSQVNLPSSIQMHPIGILPDVGKSQTQPQLNPTERGGISYQPPELDHEFRISMRASVLLLISSACVVSICAEYMVNSIEHVVANARLTEAFLGLIILPLVGNTAELVTAVTVATKNKMDLAINVTVGSAIQITLFMVPAMVALGWITDRNVSLFFDMFQTVALLVTMMMVNFLLLSGRTSYLLGAMLMVCYVIIGIGAFVLPNQNHKTHSVKPT